MRGVGTQQVERFLTERFPAARLARMDLDTTSTKWSHHRILESFGRGDADILVGTQMIAKGLDFPNVTLVGVIDADMSHPPALLPRMLAVMQSAGADVVVASRYIPGGGTRNWEKSRLIMSRIACMMARGLTPIRDATSGFFLIRRELARGVHISAGGFKICLELLVRSRPAVVVEVPYVFVGRTAGESKMNFKEAMGYLHQLKALRGFVRSQATLQQTYRRLTVSELQSQPGAGGVRASK